MGVKNHCVLKIDIGHWKCHIMKRKLPNHIIYTQFVIDIVQIEYNEDYVTGEVSLCEKKAYMHVSMFKRSTIIADNVIAKDIEYS